MEEMHVYKLNGYDNNEITVKNNYKFKYPPNMPRQFFNCGIIGMRGCGKTNSLCNIVKFYKNYIDNIYLICPNYHNELKLKQELPESENTFVFIEPNNTSLNTIIENINNEIELYKEYLKNLKIWQRFQKVQDISMLDDNDIIKLTKMGFKQPTCKYKNYPTSLIILDDCIESEIYKPTNKLLRNFTIRHRHLFTNIIFVSQHYFSLPRVLRTNCSWFILYKTRDEKLLKEIYKEVAGHFSIFDHFKRIYDYATNELHDFLYIDTDSKTNNIRKNFNQIIN